MARTIKRKASSSRGIPLRTSATSAPGSTAPKKAKTLSSPAIQQRSALLDLPCHLRHRIYTELLRLEPAITVSQTAAAPHPLTQACCQLRKDFLATWINHATVSATEFHFEIKNFDFKDAKAFIQKLSLLKPGDQERKLFVHLRPSSAIVTSDLQERTIEALDDWVVWIESRKDRLRAGGRDCGMWYGFDFEVDQRYVKCVADVLMQESPGYARMRPKTMRLHENRIMEALNKAYMVGDEIVEEKYGKRRALTARERDVWDRL